MFITASGIMLRTDLSQIREIGRATQGVRLIRAGENDKVVAVATIVKEDDGVEDATAGDAGVGGATGDAEPTPPPQ